MSTAATLLRRLVEKAAGESETGYVLVLDGEGLEGLPDVLRTPTVNWQVARAQTEVGLRHLLWRARGAPLIVVLPEALGQKVQRTPDLLRRSRNQRVHALAGNDVLEVLLGVRVVGADQPHLLQLALAHCQALRSFIGQRTLPTVIDRRLLTELLVDASVGAQVRTTAPGRLLADWVLEPPRWSEEVAKLVGDALPSLHGDEGRLLSWALTEPERLMRALVVYGAVLTVEAPEVPKAAYGPLHEAAQRAPIELDLRIVRRTAARIAEEALVALGGQGAPLLEAADKVARETLRGDESETSRLLPLAFATRCHTLATRAARGEAVGAGEVAWLAAHRVAPLRRPELAVIEALARLSRYVTSDAVTPSSVLDHVQAYQRGGAFADLAMQQLRRALGNSEGHHAEAGRVLTAARARRDAENRAFAELLAADYSGALHDSGVTPLHRLWKRAVAPEWEKNPGLGIFLVVLDGCSYPVFLDLLGALSEAPDFPLGLAVEDVDGGAGKAVELPGLAPLPTITSHARGAIFLGELPQDRFFIESAFQGEEETRTDKARFNQNTVLGGRTRKLFLKGDLSDGAQGLLACLEDASTQVVAAVFNAVDDQIGSSNTGATVRLTPGDIAGLVPALKKALKAGRKVLLTADHGHSPWQDKGLRVGSGKTPRYLELGARAEAPEGFIEVGVGALGGVAARRAFAWRQGVYLGGPQVGFHGGCALEEMVVPLAWIVRDGVQATEPGWWFGRGALAEPAVPVAPKPLPLPPMTEPPRKVAQQQPSLFDPGARAEGLPLPAEVLAALGDDERALLVILRDVKTARASELAERLGKNPLRLNGLLVQLRRKLHAQELVLFGDELLPTGETMYRYLGEERRR